MFEFRQDTALLQGAFLSAQRQIQLAAEVPNRNLCRLSEKQLNILTELVTGAVALAKKGSWCAKWENPDALLADMRAHAAVFYTVLKSTGIACNAADNYYSALSSIFPFMDWSVYVALLKSCQWCEFFVQCVNDVPYEVVPCILENILAQIKDKKEEHDYHILSTVLQVILQKSLNFKPATIYKQLQEGPPKFSFPFFYVPSGNLFLVEETVSPLEGDVTSQEISSLSGAETASETPEPLTFSDLLDAAVMFKAEELDKSEVLKVFFHGLLTFLDISTKVKLKCLMQKFSCMEPLIRGVLNCMQSKTSVDLITLASSEFTTSSIKKDLAFNYVRWDVNITYLAVLICGGWNELSYRLVNCDGINQDSTIFEIEKITKTLFGLLPLHKKDSPEEKQFLEALTFIADNKLIGMNYVVEIFIQDPYFLEKEEIIACLERSTPQPAKETLRYALLKVIMEQTVSQKNRLVSIFFRAINDVSVTDQQQMLQYFLLKYGLNETLKQENFDKQMSPILNQTVNAEHAEKQIILLCLQSPKEFVSRIIHQAVNGNSGQIPVLAKMLKVMSSVCAFRMSQEASLLVNELKLFFSSTSLILQQLKNFKTMIQELLQVLQDNDGLKPSEFLIQCVFPCISELSNVPMSFPLEILEIVFTSSLSTKKTSWMNDLNIPAFIMYMGQIIDLSIAEMSGTLKEKAVSVLSLLSELQYLEEKERPCTLVCKMRDSWVATHLSSVNPVVKFYIWKFIEKYTSPTYVKAEISSTSSLVLIWLHSCIYEEKLTTQLKELILNSSDSNHSTLLAVSLAQVFPHLTLQEWIHSSVLLEECLEFLSLESQGFLQHDLTDRNIRLLMSVEIFVNALILLRTCTNVSFDWSYMVSSFTKVVSNQINNKVQELHPETFAKLFLELCQLAFHLEEEHLKVVNVLLFDIFKVLKEMLHVTDGSSDIFTCLYAAVDVMPDCESRSNILDSLKAF